ncbi:hypothetical protein C922_04381 [Plasmodium inui San Antonio 1]|uniref:RanBP2-type domain-containing protein n=1 Tax=Plasmodium inui San Antonio 1 TaxID=1237626 RepID=W6ZWT0_9APIC|nr:hypothetical protein C922_04381 [Plasmodium inui San Antonio 1]EUD65252.1 hypothetical protein C922_04381 [Plasmodium inui San Antonio 1]
MKKIGRREGEKAGRGRLEPKEKPRHHRWESSLGGGKRWPGERKHHRSGSSHRSGSLHRSGSHHGHDSRGGSGKRRKKKERRSESGFRGSSQPRRGEKQRRRSRSRSRDRSRDRNRSSSRDRNSSRDQRRSRDRRQHSENEREPARKARHPPQQVSYNAFDYFSNDIAREKLLPNYIMEEKNKYEKDVFEKAYGLSLGDGIIQIDQFLFDPKEGHQEKVQVKNTDSTTKHTSSKSKGHYECYSCKARNVYANVQCRKCKKLRKI